MFPYPIRELQGRVFGIVGYGTLGKAVATIARAFGMRVEIATGRAARRRAGRRDLDDLLPELDVLSLHCPLTEATRGLIGRDRLARMKPDAVLINTARGALVDARALADALKAGKLGGAGIDVLEREPPPPGHPLLDPSIPNLIVTPHVAWAAREARQRCLDELRAERSLVPLRRAPQPGRLTSSVWRDSRLSRARDPAGLSPRFARIFTPRSADTPATRRA